MTETSPVATVAYKGEAGDKYGSVGVPMPNSEIQVIRDCPLIMTLQGGQIRGGSFLLGGIPVRGFTFFRYYYRGSLFWAIVVGGHRLFLGYSHRRVTF